ncbi:uncharacterized protein LOC118349040 [Juglans regia]|uniref:PHD finger protein ALFIN-LIKE n=1 Tax=Juglans regia TaxID=51240 RepID=A0A6P9EIT0_JUGRE|nr:uncharacterized protein LOC118349040 [Juglans regia]
MASSMAKRCHSLTHGPTIPNPSFSIQKTQVPPSPVTSPPNWNWSCRLQKLNQAKTNDSVTPAKIEGAGIVLCLETEDVKVAIVKAMNAGAIAVSENRKDWLSLVAMHIDSWLLSVAFYLGACLNHNERKCLFSLINDPPTVFEVVTKRKPMKDKPNVDRGSKSRGCT